MGKKQKNTDSISLGRRIRNGKSSYLFLLPFMILFFVFTVLPVLASMVLSFTDFNMVSIPSFVGIDNYIMAFVTGPVCYLLCLGLAWLVNEVGRKLRLLFTVIFYAPSLTGSAILI